MQSLDRRLTFLEASKSIERRLERMTDAELDERIAVLMAEIPPSERQDIERREQARRNAMPNRVRSTANLENDHAKP